MVGSMELLHDSGELRAFTVIKRPLFGRGDAIGQSLKLVAGC